MSLREEADRIVLRSRAGDQHATAWIRILGKAVQQGVASAKNVKAYEAIRQAIDGLPAEPNLTISVDAARLLQRLSSESDAERQCGILSGLPLVGGKQAVAIAAVVLAGFSFSPVAVARGFAEGDAAALVLAPEIGSPETVTELAAQWVGRIVREALALQRMRAGDFFHDPGIAWELGLV